MATFEMFTEIILYLLLAKESEVEMYGRKGLKLWRLGNQKD